MVVDSSQHKWHALGGMLHPHRVATARIPTQKSVPSLTNVLPLFSRKPQVLAGALDGSAISFEGSGTDSGPY